MISLNDELKKELIALASEKNIFLEGNILKILKNDNVMFEIEIKPNRISTVVT